MQIVANTPYPNRLQMLLSPIVGPLLANTTAFDPRTQLQVYVDGMLTPIQTFAYDPVANRYLLFTGFNFNTSGVIQVIHHMPSPAYAGTGGILSGFTALASLSAALDPPTTNPILFVSGISLDTTHLPTVNHTAPFNVSSTFGFSITFSMPDETSVPQFVLSVPEKSWTSGLISSAVNADGLNTASGAVGGSVSGLGTFPGGTTLTNSFTTIGSGNAATVSSVLFTLTVPTALGGATTHLTVAGKDSLGNQLNLLNGTTMTASFEMDPVI